LTVRDALAETPPVPRVSRRRFLAALAAAACRPSPSRAPGHVAGDSTLATDELAALAAAYLRAGAGLGRRDFPAAVAAFRDALAINRGDAALAYQIASALAQAGEHAQAIAALERLAGSALVPQARDFPGLPEGALARLHARAREALPETRSAVAHTLAERDLIPEGVAHDPRTDTLFVGSIYKRKVVAVDARGGARDFVAASDDLDSPLGMKVDVATRTLWFAAPALPNMRGFTDAVRGRAAVVAADADTGRIRARYPRTTPGPHLLNDLVVAPGGAVYVTDSEAGEVLRLDPATGEFTVVIPAGEVYYPNGVALSDDGGTLFVADFVRGLTGVRTGSGERFIVAHPRGAATHGFDGLYYHRNALIGVDNGVAQGRIVRMELAPTHDQITAVDVVEAGHPAFEIPTTGTIVGEDLVYVANSQLRSFDGDSIWPPERLQPVQLLRVPLKAPA
jgi:sugar lactone lactonase YvrE